MLERYNEPPTILDDNDLDFQIVDWFIPEQARKTTFEPNNDLYDIHIYGVTDEGYSVQLVVKGFEPYFYVKCPDKISNVRKFVMELEEELLEGAYNYRITKNDFNTNKPKVQDKTAIPNYLRNHYVSMKTIQKYDFWGFQDEKKTQFIKIKVKSYKLMRMMIDVFKSEKMEKDGFKLYESNIDPFLRFIHNNEISPCGWISVNKEDITEFDTGLSQYKFEVEHNNVVSIEKNKIAPLLIASFDIECTSSHGDFPLACKDYKKLAKDLCDMSEDLFKSCEENNYNSTDILHKFLVKCFKKNVLWGNHTINQVYINGKIEKIETKHIINIENFMKNNDEISLNKYLTKHLPKVLGDPIIQIGTTFHIFGSDEIVYKNIITLNSCSTIDGVDVIECDTEKELLLEWREVLKKYNPDILTGYNIFGFDFKYIYDRTIELDIDEIFREGLGRSNERNVPFITNKMFSSAMGEVITSFYDIEGILIIDLFTYVRRNMSLESYKLDFVAETILKEHKLDLKPHEIFSKFLGNKDDRKVIAEYCIQDCALVNRLLHKMKIIENNFGMANVCYVPAKYIFHRGQTIKSLSLVSYECQKRKQCIPVLNKPDCDYDDKYEGAIVLEPESGIYMEDPIVVFDYSSLYPSSMIAENLSHDSCILEKDYKKYIDENGELISDNKDLILNKIDDGTKMCYFVKDPNKKSTIPDILEKLIKQRKITRNKIEYQDVIFKNGKILTGVIKGNKVITPNLTQEFKQEDVLEIKDTFSDFEKAVFDALQLAYKITANSLYGATGASVSPIYMKEIASCTTATGRNMIYLAKNFVEKNYGSKTVYGDSVMPYTPIIIKYQHHIVLTTFEKLEGSWKKYDQFKMFEDGLTNKEQLYMEDVKIWTSNGWSKINRIIRHKTKKTIYRIVTNCGLVDVTEDHSLLNKNKEEIKPSNCKKGIELLHSLPVFDEDELYIMKDMKNYHLKCQQNYLKLQKVYNNINIIYSGNKISFQNGSFHKDNHKIKHIEILHNNYDGYVYDIETEEGNFHAGIGELILKNTDSIFCKFEFKNENGDIVKGKEAIPYAIKLGKQIEKHIYDEILYKLAPQKLAYEKVLYPLILVSKKRYTGMLYEDDPEKCFQKTMGLQIKRRDSAKIVKDVYGGIIDKILKENDLNASFEFLKHWLEKLVKGDVDIDRLILSKTLRSNYKDEGKIAHKVLAERIKEREPGNAPQINDRLPYVYICNDDPKCLQGERIETVDYILRNNVKIDHLHYITNQIMKPILQLYELSIEKIPGYDKSPTYWIDLDKELERTKEIYRDDTKRAKRIKDLRERTVKELLFDKYIDELEKDKPKKRAKIDKEVIPEITDENILLEKREFTLQITELKQKIKYLLNVILLKKIMKLVKIKIRLLLK